MVTMSETAPGTQRPAAVWIICVILLAQGAAVILLTLAEALASRAQVLDAAGQIALVVIYVLSGVVLMLLGFRILAGAPAARTPAMVLQLLLVVLSFSFFAGGAVLVGVIFLLPAAAVLVLLFTRPVQQWLQRPAA